MAIAGQRTLTDVVIEATADSRFFTYVTVTGFGALALVLGAIGIYGVLSCVVTERLPEFGIRMALGAPASRVTREAMARLVLPVGLGLGPGVVGALATTRVLRRLLFGVSPTDPVSFTVAPVVLIAVALAAGYLAARRAGRVGLPTVLGR
ncbi:MAG: FtsX-like permease family protein [Gemmatimonadales bacterium]